MEVASIAMFGIEIIIKGMNKVQYWTEHIALWHSCGDWSGHGLGKACSLGKVGHQSLHVMD